MSFMKSDIITLADVLENSSANEDRRMRSDENTKVFYLIEKKLYG